ncbi:SDR family oxidoreductase [Nitrospiraceae bacterium HYJII51-Mn-bac16s-1-B09]|uniref:SDR family oxidoreductase n=1 Tax=Candidatus Manganitrophus noduliformans TaxID=2606439 RepID=A0A7X6IAP6_9BACT|nr:SDR family oxidoreductase [Candidatus Manganitrophus noduliformans]NKE70763.1 SDR family oxidoreductase [Candidatus Manganitrophus noduliformans]
MSARIFNMLLGVWLTAAPALLGYTGAARTNDSIVGPIVASVALMAMWEVLRPLRWINFAFGLWLIAAPSIFDYEGSPLFNSLIVGALLSSFALVRGRRTKRFGGGWSSLWRHAIPSEDQDGRPEVVVVTGASAGVGRAVVREFAKRKAKIGLLARGEDGLAGARKEVEAAGGKALVIPIDVSDAEQVEAAAAAVEEAFGPIDIWVNNAMVSVLSPVKEMPPEEFKRVTDVTYLSYVYGTLAALRRMLPRDRGTIVQVGSALAYRSIPLQSAYCGAKHAVKGFTDALRSELIHDKSRVRITMVQLPAHNTPQFSWIKTRMPNHPQPVPPIFQPEVAAEAIYWAAHHNRRELTVGWPAAKAIWGNKIIPGFLDWYLALKGYGGQQTGEPVDPNRPDNLWRPVPGDHGARGIFSHRAKPDSIHLRLNLHRGTVIAAGVIALMLLATGIFIWY